MPVRIACPKCDARLDAPDDIWGRKVECLKCGNTFRAHAVERDDPPAVPAAKSANKSRQPAADDENERRSRRTGKASRRREHDDEDDRDQDEDRPRRGSRDEDDKEGEPGPRKKKGKKRKKGVSTVVLLILIGVGVLLLVAAIGAYFSSGGGEPDEPTGGPVTGPGADPGASAGDPNLPGWLEFADPNGQFKVRMPRPPAAPTKQQWPVPNGDPAETTIYSMEIGGGLFAVAHLIVPGREAKDPADAVLDEAIGGGMNWTRGAVIKSRSNITHQGFPGRQAVLEYPGTKGTTVVRVIVAGNRMFWVLARGDNFAADTQKVRGFLESLKIN